MKPNNLEQPINGYILSRQWFDFAFENQGIVTGNHGCMFMWFIEQNNRLGWVKTFGVPRDQTMAAVGISSSTTYKKVFEDLVRWEFITVIQRSKNQFTANIIALSNNGKADFKALDRSLQLQGHKQTDSSIHGSVSLNKQLNNESLVVEEEIVVEQNPFENIPDAILYMYECKMFDAIKTKYKISDEMVVEFFNAFYKQKEQFNDLCKTKDKILENFFFWIPKHQGAQVVAKGGRKPWE